MDDILINLGVVKESEKRIENIIIESEHHDEPSIVNSRKRKGLNREILENLLLTTNTKNNPIFHKKNKFIEKPIRAKISNKVTEDSVSEDKIVCIDNIKLDKIIEEAKSKDNLLLKSDFKNHEMNNLVCPNCNEYSTFDDNFLNKHLDRCLRNKIPYDSDKLSQISFSDDTKEVEIKAYPSVNSLVDDWEDSDYKKRLSSSDAILSFESEEGLTVNKISWENLYEYQKEGCIWLYNLYQQGVGGILADEMGLGKSAQVCCHFNNIVKNDDFSSQSIGNPIFLIVCPATIMHHWVKEMQFWSPSMRTVLLHSISSTGKELLGVGDKGIELVIKKLRNKCHNGLNIITSYETLRRYKKSLVLIEWTSVCLDEGQKIRNPNTEISSVCKLLPSYHRIILSGTPIQNSLKELWNIFDFIYPGKLGTLEAFENEFANPIRAGDYSNSSPLEYEVALKCSATLQEIVLPYLLRRKKEDLQTLTKLPPKTEHVLFCQLSDKQRKIYRQVIDSEEVSKVFEKKISAFRALNTLRKLCNHPDLVYYNGRINWSNPESNKYENNMNIDLHSLNTSSTLKWEASGKLLVLSKVLPLWYNEGQKVLIFSQTRSMLNIIESMVISLGYLYLKMDGSSSISSRSSLIEKFNSDSKIFVMLLTTRTGGVGISLTAANRVVIYDPDWNPMIDIQSRERAWRLGQKKEVTIYRLITRGTIEEKIYHRQILKLLMSNRVLENSKERSIISKSDIHELFSLKENFSDGNSEKENKGYDKLPESGIVDLFDHSKKIDNMNDTDNELKKNGFDVEVFQEDTKADEIISGLIVSDNSESNPHDTKLLQALFEGKALVSVYDHDAVDPQRKRKVNPILQKKISQRADKILKKAIDSLDNSTKELKYASPNSSKNSIYSLTSATGNYQKSSSRVIDMIKSKQNNIENIARENSLKSSNISAPISSSSSSIVTSSNSNNNSTKNVKKSSIKDEILERLTLIFNNHSRIKSQQLLNYFQDFGDQYAPLFKSLLKSIANYSEGYWERK